MKQFECVCGTCKSHRQIAFPLDNYPEYGAVFSYYCEKCGAEREFTRALTRKTAAELRRKDAELKLQNDIIGLCHVHGFKCRFLYQSVIVTTELSDWCFDYHQSRVTLYHQSTYPFNLATGDPAKSHIQFAGKKMSLADVFDYIAKHDHRRSTGENEAEE